MKPELRNAIQIGEFVLLGAGSLVLPNIARAESQLVTNSSECIKQPQGDLILLGGEGCFGRLNILLVGQNGTTLPMITETKEDLTSIDPMQEIIGDANIYGLLNAESLGCNQTDSCDWTGAVKRLIDRVAATGMIPHKTMVVVRSNDEGGTGFNPLPLPSHLSKPDIYSPSAVVRPVDTRGSNREVAAGTVEHEFLHQFAGFDHEGGDIMERKCNCINPQHAQFLRSLKPLIPFNYDVKPVLKLIALSSLQTTVSQDTIQLNDMGFILNLQSPPGTTQLYSEVIPYNNDGAGVFDYARGDLAVHAWGEAGRRVPPPPQWYGILPDMTYTWRVRLSGLATPIVDAQGRVIRDDPRWDKTEIWPGVFDPNPWAEVKIHTPATTLDTIALKNVPTTNDLTPTLIWENTNNKIFYYEVQVSKDSSFNTDPATATAMVYWELRHGGVTNPANSYTIPPEFPLEKGTTYFWRVRPRVQGDGKPMPWTPAAKITTTADAKIMAYSKELVDKYYGDGVWGPSKKDYDEYAGKEPEDITPSALARVVDTNHRRILIPEQGAPDYSNSPVQPVSMAEYRAYLRASEKRLQRGRKFKAAA